MYTILLIAAIGLIIGFLVASKGIGAKLFGLAVGCVIGAFVGTFIADVAVGSFVPRKEVVYGPATLVSMRTSDGVTGTFIWGSGGFGSQSNYNFMMKLGNGNLTPRSVAADDLVQIREDAKLNNVGYWRTIKSEPDLTSPLAPWAIGLTKERNKTILRHEFDVPAGTVVQTFKVQ